MNKTLIILLGIIVLFSGCSRKGARVYKSKNTTYAKKDSVVKNSHNKKAFSRLKMNPYVVRGIKYYPETVSKGDTFKGSASWYGPQFHNKLTANGEIYDMYDMTAAHKTLPMHTVVKVTNHLNGLSTTVRINDRGPFVDDRIIDLSKKAAKKIDMIGVGTAPVTLEIIDYDKSLEKSSPIRKKEFLVLNKSKKEKYALQLASFAEIEGALAIQKRYNNMDGYKTIIKDNTSNGVGSYKVWLIGFNSEQEIRTYKADGEFENAFIVKED